MRPLLRQQEQNAVADESLGEGSLLRRLSRLVSSVGPRLAIHDHPMEPTLTGTVVCVDWSATPLQDASDAPRPDAMVVGVGNMLSASRAIYGLTGTVTRPS